MSIELGVQGVEIELGSTYVTGAGDWVKIVSKSCSIPNTYPFEAENGILYSPEGHCGVDKWALLYKVPADQVVFREIEDMLFTLAGDDIGLNKLVEMRSQANRLLTKEAFRGLIKQAYR
jgi:hypothetical protein